MKADYVGLELALDHPIMSSGTDRELADDHGVSLAYVRERRRVRREDLLSPEVRRLALEVAQLNGWEEPAVDTIRTALRALRLAALADRAARSAALYKSFTGARRSADGTMGRDRTTAEASEGHSGDRDPSAPVSRGTGWGRDRGGHGSGAVSVTREG